MGFQEPHEIQQRLILSPVPGEAEIPLQRHKQGPDWLGSSSLENDLVMLGMSQQYALAAKAKRFLGYTTSNTVRTSRPVITALSSLLLRLHLESCAQFWGTPFKNDIDRLGKCSKGLSGEAERGGFV